FLGVALLEEALGLRRAGIKTPIVILGGIYPGQANEIVKHELRPAIFDLTIARELNQAALKRKSKVKVHVKIDTGMGRLGILPEESHEFFNQLKKLTSLEIEGIISHLTVASQENDDEVGFTRQQSECFHRVIDDCRKTGANPPLLHLANSAAIIRGNLDQFTLVRPGIMLYGSHPAPTLADAIRLKPMMSLKSRVLQLKRLPRGHSVSYGRTFICLRETLVAVIPIGYADGYSRLLSNCGEVLIRGEKAPVIGVVCMDLTMADVTDVDGVKAGDEVVLIGRQGKESITAEDIAEKIGTISYEVLCRIGQRVPRIYRKGRRVIKEN
ncbi:MAG TPA: alanine racemase, partial [Thermodesulfobacteriota bacterium]|nr:alanine racemase [Thermodesulfobacteriota bacterium]